MSILLLKLIIRYREIGRKHEKEELVLVPELGLALAVGLGDLGELRGVVLDVVLQVRGQAAGLVLNPLKEILSIRSFCQNFSPIESFMAIVWGY